MTQALLRDGVRGSNEIASVDRRPYWNSLNGNVEGYPEWVENTPEPKSPLTHYPIISHVLDSEYTKIIRKQLDFG